MEVTTYDGTKKHVKSSKKINIGPFIELALDNRIKDYCPAP